MHKKDPEGKRRGQRTKKRQLASRQLSFLDGNLFIFTLTNNRRQNPPTLTLMKGPVYIGARERYKSRSDL
jgi:hypothetical protein